MTPGHVTLRLKRLTESDLGPAGRLLTAAGRRRSPTEAFRSGLSPLASPSLGAPEERLAEHVCGEQAGRACPVTTQALSETLEAFELDRGTAGNERAGRVP